MIEDSALSISLNDQQKVYYPGDIVAGDITLSLTKDSVIGNLIVRFWGCSKSKIMQSNGQSMSTFHGRSELFSRQITLHDDHYTHKSDGYSWPFKFEVPGTTESTQSSDKWSFDQDFRANDAQTFSLPPSFHAGKSGSGKAWDASVMYAIEVTVTSPEKQKALETRIRRALQPLCILPAPTHIPVDGNDPQQRRDTTETFTIRSLRLLPDNTDQISIMQRAKAALDPASVPKFTFELDVSYPILLQTHHRASLPFIVAAIPKTEPDLTTIQPTQRTFYRYPPLKVKRFELSLQATTKCRCPTGFSTIDVSTVHDITLANSHFDDLLLNIRSLAWDQKNRVTDSAPTCIDFGKVCDIFVKDEPDNGQQKRKKGRTSSAEKAQNSKPMTPSFTTVNVSRTYYLAWTIEFECVKEKIVCRGRSPEEITIVGPGYEHVPIADLDWTAELDASSSHDSASPRLEHRESGAVGRATDGEVLPAYSVTHWETAPVSAHAKS